MNRFAVFATLVGVVSCASPPPPKKLIQAPSRVEITKVVVLSGLSKGRVVATVSEREPELAACYAGLLRDRPVKKAKLVIRFTVAPNGVVSSAALEGRSINDSGFESCVLSEIRTTRFPALDVPALTEVAVFTLEFFPPRFPAAEPLPVKRH